MILEPPASGEWTVEDLERLNTGDFHLELDTGQLRVRPAARPPRESHPSDALVRIHHLVTDTGGPIYRLERTIRLSKLEQEEPGTVAG